MTWLVCGLRYEVQTAGDVGLIPAPFMGPKDLYEWTGLPLVISHLGPHRAQALPRVSFQGRFQRSITSAGPTARTSVGAQCIGDHEVRHGQSRRGHNTYKRLAVRRNLTNSARDKRAASKRGPLLGRRTFPRIAKTLFGRVR